MTAPLACWRCEQPGHPAAECQRPQPQSRKERDARNARHVQRWHDGEISQAMKRQFITAENNALKAFEKARAK